MGTERVKEKGNIVAGMILDGIGCCSSGFSSAYRQMMRIGR
jgi:hypothetical protein